MRKYITFVVASSLLFCGSCTSFLEETNPNKIPANNFYQTEDDTAMAVNGAYVALRGNGRYRNMYLYADVRSGSTTLQDPGAGNGVNYQLCNYTLTTDDVQVKTYWADLYRCVTRANTILDQIDDTPFRDEVMKDKKKTEIYLLHRSTYFHLVVQFGDVPITTKGLKTKDEIQKYTARQPENGVYNLITSDLTQVTNSGLPDIQTGNGVDRVSKAATYVLLGKVYLTMATDSDFRPEGTSNSQSAKASLVTVWNMGPFISLKGISYADVFDKEARTFCQENISQVMCKGGNSSLTSNYAYIFQSTFQTGFISQKTGTENDIPTADTMDAYESGDTCRAISCSTSQDVNYMKKYTDLDDVNGYGTNNWIVFRYTDVALMLAGMKMHLSENDAVSYLNMVRKRAGLDDHPDSSLRDAILHERKVEFAFERQYWYDLLRLYFCQELLEHVRTKNPNFSMKDSLLPIPYDEHKLDSIRMYQNEEYN